MSNELKIPGMQHMLGLVDVISPEMRIKKKRYTNVVYIFEGFKVKNMHTGTEREIPTRMAAIREQARNTSKYMPHQGAKECARRRAA